MDMSQEEIKHHETESKLTAIRQACVAANPEIVELKEGCLVAMKKYRGKYVEMLNYSISKPVPIVSTCDGVGGVKGNVYIDNFGAVSYDGIKRVKNSDEWVEAPSRISKIIGRPIRLADVLLAWKGIKQDWKRSEDTDIHGTVSIVARWNLRHDNLAAQSPETLDFLYDLLKTNPT